MQMIRPLGDRVVVEVTEAEDVSPGGIVLPDTAQEKPQRGKVVAVGPGRVLETGETGPMGVKVGDIIIFSKYGGTEIKLDGKEYTILRESDVLTILEE
jgi:chaperonin GroES